MSSTRLALCCRGVMRSPRFHVSRLEEAREVHLLKRLACGVLFTLDCGDFLQIHMLDNGISDQAPQHLGVQGIQLCRTAFPSLRMARFLGGPRGQVVLTDLLLSQPKPLEVEQA